MEFTPIIKGTSLEIQIASAMVMFPEIKVMLDVRAYSHIIRKQTQIDIVLLAPWAYICIEAKNYASEITGSLNDAKWFCRSWKRSRQILNPVNQNTIHTIALSSMIYHRTRQYLHFENLVVVPDECTINSDTPMVMNLSELVSFVGTSMHSRRDSGMNTDGVFDIIRKSGKEYIND